MGKLTIRCCVGKGKEKRIVYTRKLRGTATYMIAMKPGYGGLTAWRAVLAVQSNGSWMIALLMMDGSWGGALRGSGRTIIGLVTCVYVRSIVRYDYFAVRNTYGGYYLIVGANVLRSPGLYPRPGRRR